MSGFKCNVKSKKFFLTFFEPVSYILSHTQNLKVIFIIRVWDNIFCLSSDTRGPLKKYKNLKFKNKPYHHHHRPLSIISISLLTAL